MHRFASFVLAPLAVVALCAIGLPAAAGRPRTAETLDQDELSLLPFLASADPHSFGYVRAASGEALLLDGSASSPLRATPLGFAPPAGANRAAYTATPDGTVWAAFSSDAGIRVVDLGEVTAPGPLAPALVEALTVGAGFAPDDVQLGIIAVLIGLLVEPRPALVVGDCATGECSVYGWDGAAFRPVHLMEEEGTYYF